MGGHGALVIGLRNPGIFKSISAFSPICAPMQCPWGVKAFTNYLGENKALWKEYDATEIVKSAIINHEILIDQGTGDKFLEEQFLFHILNVECSIFFVPCNHEAYKYSQS